MSRRKKEHEQAQGFRVRHTQCDQCLYSKNRIVSKARVKAVLAGCAKSGSHFECHKATISGAQVCCRGFYDADRGQCPTIAVAKALNGVVFTDDNGQAVLNG
jgi:hypothetical protein